MVIQLKVGGGRGGARVQGKVGFDGGGGGARSDRLNAPGDAAELRENA